MLNTSLLQGAAPPQGLLSALASAFAERGLQQIGRQIAHRATLGIASLHQLVVGAVRQGDRDAMGNAKDRCGGEGIGVHGCSDLEQPSVLCRRSDAVKDLIHGSHMCESHKWV
jgi:hypothetical protein